MSLLQEIKALKKGESITLSKDIVLIAGSGDSFSIEVKGQTMLVLDVTQTVSTLTAEILSAIIAACEKYRDDTLNDVYGEIMQAVPDDQLDNLEKLGIEISEPYAPPIKRTTRRKPQ